MDKLLKTLQTADVRLAISENGYGCKFSNNLMETSGASKVLVYTESPYSKELCKNKDVRAVSTENVVDKVRDLNKRTPANMFIATSFQSGSNSKYAHGFVAVKYEDVRGAIEHERVYHLSFGFEFPKKDVNIAISVFLYNMIIAALDGRTPNCSSIDGVFNFDGNLIINQLPEKFKAFAITPEGKWARALDAVRDMEEVNVLKGSFNPIHDAHIQMLSTTNRNILGLCTSTVQGKETDIEDLIMRANLLVEQTGSWCILSTNSLATYQDFHDFVKRLNKKVHCKYPMGADVFSKLDVTTLRNFDATVVLYSRNVGDTFIECKESVNPDISSTALRNDMEL